ncbi:MAG: phycobiliprotein lyase [Cyanobacteria bacterium J06627_28]
MIMSAQKANERADQAGFIQRPEVFQPSELTASELIGLEERVIAFFQHSEGNWQSRRRYYTLANDETQEVVSDISIQFLEPDHAELVDLGVRHELTVPMICGAKVTWESTYLSPSRKPSIGSTVFGIRGNIMYRDRGFATPKPVTALYKFKGDRTMTLRTEYGGSSFEEELKLIGENYRTRQTIISRSGEEIMVGQYLEKRV